MTKIIIPAPLAGRITAISSKSDVHRALIAAALSDGATDVVFSNDCEDIAATLSCITALGCRIQPYREGVTVTPIMSGGSTARKTPLLNCNESGSTARFLIPVAAALGGARFVGSGRLPERPMGELLDCLRRRGCEIDGDNLPLNVGGGLTAGIFEISGKVSSQFISGLLFALPLLGKESEIVLTSPLESAGYVDMTIQTLARFGVEVERTSFGFRVAAGATYKSPKTYAAEGDWSNGSMWLCAAALGGSGITVDGLSLDAVQGDKEAAKILTSFGANVTSDGSRTAVTSGSLRGISLNAAQIPDLVPIIAVLAAASARRTVIYGAERLRLKESDRLESVAAAVNALGGRAAVTPDGLIIDGAGGLDIDSDTENRPLSGGTVDSAGDHRIVMAAMVASVASRGAVTVTGANAINKSYPTAFDDFIALGGKIL